MIFSKKFICAGKKYSALNRRVPAPLFLKKISVSGKVEKAEITVCGLGFYELFLNGENITKGRLCPYISNSEQVIFYDNYDITELLKEENSFEFMLGNGMQNAFGGFIWDFEKTGFRSAPKLAFAVEIAYIDGRKEIYEADESVTAAQSNILSDDLRLGEIYDANKNERKWKNAVLSGTPRGKALLSRARPITVRQALKPVSIFREGNAYIYDFGINTSGVCRLSLNAEKGQTVKLTFAEILRDGKFCIDTTTFNHSKKRYCQSDTYICKDGYNEWAPAFTYHGFRYVKAEGISEEQATPELLTYLVFNTDLEELGEFSCDCETLNKLHKMTLNSTLSNFHHFPTDCPHREKNGWTADAALSSSHTLLFFDAVENYKQWLACICRAQREDGALPGIVPTWGWGFDWGNGPAWDSVITELPYQIWQKRNDLSAFKMCGESVIKYIRYLDTKKDKNGLLSIGLGDWCAPKSPHKAPLILTDSIEAFDIAKKASEMFRAIGEAEKARFCGDFAERMRSNIRDNLFNKESCVFEGESQTSQAMGIYYGIVDDSEKSRAFNVLKDIIKRDDYHITTGVLGGRVLFHVLSENGEIDSAIKILTNKTPPSYRQWLAEGNMSLCENFDVDEDGLASHNHHFWGNISAFFTEQICGIKVCADTVNIEPHFPDALNSARASYKSVFGEVSVSWVREKDTVNFKLKYPQNAKGVFKYGDFICSASSDNLREFNITVK